MRGYLEVIVLYIECGYNASVAMRAYLEQFPHPTNTRVILNAFYSVSSSVDGQRGGQIRGVQ